MRNSKIVNTSLKIAIGLFLVVGHSSNMAATKDSGSEGSGLTTKITFSESALPKTPDKVVDDRVDHGGPNSSQGSDGSGSVTVEPPAGM